MVEVSSRQEILSYQNQLDKKPLCIIANGPSVANLNLSKIDCATMGLNKAWMLGEWSYYVMGDSKQYQAAASRKLSPVFTYPSNPERDPSTQPPEHAIKIPLLFDPNDRRRISLDLTEGIYGNNTVTAFGLQVAFWLGADPIYIVGLDACNRPGKGHFWGGKEVPERKFAKHREGYGYIQGLFDGMVWAEAELYDGIPANFEVKWGSLYIPHIINLNLDSRSTAFERQNFDSIFKG